MEYGVELYLLKLFLSPEHHNRLSEFVNGRFIGDNNRLLGQLFQAVAAYHEKYPAQTLSATDLQVWFLSLYPSLSDNDQKLLAKLCENLEKIEAKPELADEYIQRHLDQSRAMEIVGIALKVAEGKEPYEKLASKVANSGPQIMATTGRHSTSIQRIVSERINQPGIRFRLKTLRSMLGSLRAGNFGFIFARPETGKTTFIASELSFFLDQINDTRPTLWINNEESDDAVIQRVQQAYYGVDQAELVRNLEKYEKDFPHQRLFFPEPNVNSCKGIERVCEAVKPSLIIIDQLDKVKGFTDDRKDVELTAAYQWARELSKSYAPVLAVSQAGVSAEGKKYLTMDDVFGSKTGKQGEADWMLGIGKTHQAGMENVRHFHVVKNKLIQDADMDPTMRHGMADVLIVPEIARYKDIG